jgi:hypothetical protein
VNEADLHSFFACPLLQIDKRSPTRLILSGEDPEDVGLTGRLPWSSIRIPVEKVSLIALILVGNN